MGSKIAAFVGTGTALVAGVFAFGARGQAAAAASNAKAVKPELIELGRRLFMDPTVSRLGRHSCASCHDPERAFGDPRPVSPDDKGPTKRHSQTLLDLTGEGYHWDGEFRTVRQLLVARVAPPEMANAQSTALAGDRIATARRAGASTTAAGAPAPVPGTRSEPVPSSAYGPVTPSEVPITPVAERLAEDDRYAEAFRAAFGTQKPTTERILDAMDAYCASIRSTTNGFDRFVAGDDAALAPAAKRGLALFDGKAGCAQCHLTKPNIGPTGGRSAFTDGRFHDTGVAYHSDPLWHNGLEGPAPQDAGRGGVTLLPGEVSRFKTPTLRDVALRAPYMHDASFATLADVVRYYDGGGTKNPNIDPAIHRLGLSETDVTDIVAFLESLTGERRAGLGFPSAHAAPLKIRVEDLAGRPMPCFTLVVEPAGDRLAGAETVEFAAQALTGDDGSVLIARPLTTHVKLTNPMYELGLSRPIPDTCEAQTLIATPRDSISLRIRRAPGAPDLPERIDVITVAATGSSMAGCGGAAPVVAATLRRLRTIAPGEALYAAPAVANGTTRRCTLSFEGTPTAIVADVALGGGASESILLDLTPHRATVLRDAPPEGAGERPKPPGDGRPHAPGADHGGPARTPAAR